MPLPIRSYKVKDVDMLIAASAIINAAIDNKTYLQTKRSNWTDVYLDTLKTKIDTAVQNNLGADNAKDLRQSTQTVLALQAQAIANLAEVKVQITEDFKSDKPRRDEVLMQLGFTTFLKRAQARDQEALIQLLYRFKTNLTAALKTEISDKGTSLLMLNTIIGYADTLKNANVGQESFKGTRKVLSAAVVNEFNEIHTEVITIAVIAAKLFRLQPAIADQFSFNKVTKALNSFKNKEVPPPLAAS